MAVVVFDSDVLIGLLISSDVHRRDATSLMREASVPGTLRMLCAVNYSEILIGPLRAGKAEVVDEMLGHFFIDIVQVDMALARRAAAVRERTGIALPDAFAIATAIHAEKLGHSEVRLASFDKAVLRAHADLHPYTS